MTFVDLVALLALIQFITFAVLCGKARGRYKVEAPATTGNEIFERYYRVQMNTLELLILFIPLLYIAAKYWNPLLCAGVGFIFIVGRILYFRAYIKDPATRSFGYGLSALPVIVLLVAALFGIVVKLVAGV
jgi:glutathione S-transferase